MSPTSTVSEYMTAASASERGVMIFALWRHGLHEARRLAHDCLRGPEPVNAVVFARLVDDKPLAADELAALLQQGIRVVPLSSRYRDAADSTLQEAVLERLKTADRALKLARHVHPPALDVAAAKAVKEAYARMPPVTPLQRQEFLDEYYAADRSDNSVS